MKLIPLALKNELKSETQTIATLFTVKRKDGKEFRYTDHDEDIVLFPNTPQQIVFSASIGYTPTAIESNASLSVDNLDIQGAITDETITQDDLNAGVWDYAEVTIELIDYTNPNQGTLIQRFGRMGEIKLQRGSFSAEIRGLTQNVQQVISKQYLPACNANLFDNRCKVIKENFTISGSVTGLISNSIIRTDITTTSNLYNFGIIEFTSGLNNGLKIEVKTNEFSENGMIVYNIISLQDRVPFKLEIGDTFLLSEGCNKTLARCKQFNNVVNFRGFPHIPGNDYLVSGKK